MKVCIAGVGGVGGTLAGVFGQEQSTELSLIAHGNRKDFLKKYGLFLHSDLYGELCIKARYVEENGSALPPQDMIFICVKNYSLSQICEQISPCVDKETIIIPVMNGIEAADYLSERFPENRIVDAVIYTISSAEPDFSIRQNGWNSRLIVGTRFHDDRHIAAAKKVYEYVSGTGYHCSYSEDAYAEMWIKFIQNCGFNTITTRYLTNAGEIRENETYKNDLQSLFQETYNVALACGAKLPPDTVQQRMDFITVQQVPSATSSMRRDVEAGRKTEIDTFLGALIRKAETHNIPVPVARKYYDEIKKMIL